MERVLLFAAMLTAAGCSATSDTHPAGSSEGPAPTAASGPSGKGLAAKDNDPQYEPLAQGFKACKSIDTYCAVYKDKDKIGEATRSDAAAKTKARTTFLNWLEEPSAWQIRNAGAHILWTQWLIDEASAKDAAIARRVLAALKLEPTLGTADDNRYTAGQMADVLVRFAQGPAAPDVAAFVGQAGYGFPSAQAEVVRLLGKEAYNSPAFFPTLKTIAGDEKAPAEILQMVRDTMSNAAGENAAWATQWLQAQLGKPDHAWAGGAARPLARIGGADGYAAVVAEVTKRADSDDFLYYGLWALSDFFRRTDLAVDKKAGVAIATKVANDATRKGSTRAAALEAVFSANDPSFPSLAARLGKDKDKAVADKAAALLKRHQEQKTKPSK